MHVLTYGKMAEVAMLQREKENGSLSDLAVKFIEKANFQVYIDDVDSACARVEAPQPSRSSVFSKFYLGCKSFEVFMHTWNWY